MQVKCWNGVDMDINATCNELRPEYLQLMSICVLSGCDTVSYPFSMGKISVLNTLKASHFPEFFQVVGEEDATHSGLMETGQRFFASMYGRSLGTR